MDFKLKHYNLLVVSSSQGFSESMQQLLQQNDRVTVKYVSSVSIAQRSLLERSYDLLIINTPLTDEFGSRFSIDASLKHNAIAMLVVKGDVYEGVYSKVVDHGVYVLPKPISSHQMQRAIEWMCATRERIRVFEKKTVTLEERMSEIRIVNHAKWLLIEKQNMSEADAHRYIEKQAMDKCVSKAEIAKEIIDSYT